MPDHGVRMPSYLSGSESMGILGVAPYGWYGTPAYRADQLPANDYFPADQFAYERVDWAGFSKQIKSKGYGGSATMRNWTNPPFLGAGNMLRGVAPDGSTRVPEWMRLPGGGVARILRGHVRRQTNIDTTEMAHFVRLHFMWNPTELTRQYISWGETDSLDPQGGLGVETDNHLQAAFGMTELGFSLYFDRQVEVASIPHHPGVLVDLQAFDVLAGDALQRGTRTIALRDDNSNTTPPDSGVANVDVADAAQGGINTTSSGAGNMMINPNIMLSVVLSPTMAFDGRLSSAVVTFTKFSSRMVPTAMRLDFTIRLSRVGNMTKQSSDTAGVAAGNPAVGGTFDPSRYVPIVDPTTWEQVAIANKTAAAQAVNFGMTLLNSAYIPKLPSGQRDFSKRNEGPPCNQRTPVISDCSSFIWRCFHAIGMAGKLRLGSNCDNIPSTPFYVSVLERCFTESEYNASHPDTATQNPPWFARKIEGWSSKTWKNHSIGMLPGDIYVRGDTKPGAASNGHIVFFAGFVNNDDREDWDANNCRILHSTPENVKVVVVTGRHLAENYTWYGQPRPFMLAKGEGDN